MKLIRPFFFGILASVVSLAAESLLVILLSGPEGTIDMFFENISPLLVGAVLIEEIFKLAFVYKICEEIRRVSERSKTGREIENEIFFSSIFIGIGFAIIEIFFIFFGITEQKKIFDTVSSLFGIVVIHTSTAAVIGYVLSRSKEAKWTAIPKALLIAFVLHAAYNLLMIYSASPSLALIYPIFLFLVLSGVIFKIFLKREVSSN